MTASLSLAGSWPCSSPSRRPASSAAASRSRSSDAGPGLDPLRFLDQRAHHVGLVARRHLVAHPLPRFRLLQRPRAQSGGDRSPAGRQLVEHRRVEVAVDGHGRRARNRRGRHHQDVGHHLARTLFPQGGPLLDAETVLLVDDDAPERPERHRLGQQGVGADEDVDGPLGQSRLAAGPARAAPVRLVSKRHPERPVGQQRSARSARVRPAQQGADRRHGAARPAPRSEPSAPPGGRPATAVSSAATATTVLPEPTSPCSSRCMGWGPAMSVEISAMARSWAPVREKGSRVRKRSTSSPSTRWRIPTDSRSTARFRITRITWRRSSSSKASRRRARWLAPIESGLVDLAHGPVPVRPDSRRSSPVRREGVHERSRPAAGPPPPSRPSCQVVQAGLLRLRVHRDDPPGAVADQIDDGIGHLLPAPEALDLAEHDHLGALAVAASPATAG